MPVFTVSWTWETEWTVLAESRGKALAAAKSWQAQDEALDNAKSDGCRVNVFNERELTSDVELHGVEYNGELPHPDDAEFNVHDMIERQRAAKHERMMVERNLDLFGGEGDDG